MATSLRAARRFLFPIAVAAIALLWLFPPWLLIGHGAYALEPIPAHHHFIATGLPLPAEAIRLGQRSKIDIDQLMSETCALAIAAAALYCLLSLLPDRRPTRLPKAALPAPFVPSRN